MEEKPRADQEQTKRRFWSLFQASLPTFVFKIVS